MPEKKEPMSISIYPDIWDEFKDEFQDSTLSTSQAVELLIRRYLNGDIDLT